MTNWDELKLTILGFDPEGDTPEAIEYRRKAAERDAVYAEAEHVPCECGRDGCYNVVHPTEGVLFGYGPAGCPL